MYTWWIVIAVDVYAVTYNYIYTRDDTLKFKYDIKDN